MQTNFENVCHSIIKGTVVMTTPERTEATPKTSVHRVVAVVNNHRLQAIGNLIPKAHSANQSLTSSKSGTVIVLFPNLTNLNEGLQIDQNVDSIGRKEDRQNVLKETLTDLKEVSIAQKGVLTDPIANLPTDLLIEVTKTEIMIGTESLILKKDGNSTKIQAVRFADMTMSQTPLKNVHFIHERKSLYLNQRTMG